MKHSGAFLNHIGIAVENAPSLARMKKLFSILGLPSDLKSEAVPDQGVVTHFLPLPVSSSQLEFLEVSDPEGTVAQFLKKRGPGIHHLSFEVPQGRLDPLSETLRKEGFRLIYSESRMGAHSMRLNFIHPKDAGGVLIEIMEKAPAGVTGE
jgi:methylmalonyl-CoA/ethylmalonyl-CoA epimerase